MSYRLSALAMCAVFAVASVCQASLGPLQVKIDDGVDAAVIAVDQGANDGSNTDGVVLLSTATTNWLSTVSTGISEPAIGSTTVPAMDLSSVNVTSMGSAGSITISFTGKYNPNDPVIPGFIHSIGGTTQGTITTELWWGEEAFELDVQLSAMTPTLTGVGPSLIFSEQTATINTSEGTGSAYWLTLIAHVEHTGSGPQTTSFNAAVDSVPEPASIAIWTLMAGIGGLIWMRRRSK